MNNLWLTMVRILYLFSEVLLKSDEEQTNDIIPTITDNGRYYVIEITSMCTKNKSIYLNYEAIRLHLKLRYFIGRQQKRNPVIKIGFVSYDVCNNSTSLTNVLSKIFLDRKFRGYAPTLINKTNTCTKGDCASYLTNIIAVVSFMPHNMTLIASDILTINSVPYFAYCNSDVPITSRSNENIYFHSSDKLLNADLYEIEKYIRDYHFKHIALVNIKTGTDSLSSIHRKHLWKLLIKHPNLCVDIKDLNPYNSTEISDYINDIKDDVTLRMVIIWSKRSFRKNFINLTSEIVDRVWFWYSDNSFDHNYEYDSNPLTLENHVFIWHPVYVYQHLNVRFTYRMLKINIRSSTYNQIIEDRWIKRFIKENNLNRNNSELFAIFDGDKSITGEHIETLITSLWWSQPFVVLYRHALSILWKKIQRLTEVRMCRHVVIKAANKTRLSCDYQDINILLKALSRYNEGTCEVCECLPGFQPSKEIFIKKGYINVLRWRCQFCPNHHVKSNYGNNSCNTCYGITIPNKDRTNCFDPYKEVFLRFTDSKSIVVLVLILPFTALNLISLCVFYRYRLTPFIISSGVCASIIQLTTHLFIFIEILVLFFGKLNLIKCVSQVFVSGSLLTLILSTIFTETQKILFAFGTKVRLSKVDVVISKAVEIFVSVALMVTQAVLCIVCYTQNIPNVEVILNRHDVTRTVKCRNNIYFRAQFIYILTLAFLCSIQAFRARNLPKQFTGTTEIAYSMYVTVVIICIRFPIISSHRITDQNFVNAIFIALINIFQLCIRYTRTVYIVIFQQEKNTKQYIHNMIMSDISKKTEKSIQRRVKHSTIVTAAPSTKKK